METKRCRHCHTLQDADARVCIYCGHKFAPSQQRNTSRHISSSALPPASPHQAGHYAGLHPEDQPYQSSMLIAQRVKGMEPAALHTPEPGHIILPPVDSPRYTPPGYQRVNWTAPQKKRFRWQPALLTCAFIFLLIASSLLILIAVTRNASITSAAISASPDVVTATVPPAPSLSLSTTSCPFGVAAAGTVSQQQITLINSSSEQITWRASSDQSWLSVSPSAGLFSGREDVTISVNRAGLAAQDYTGQIIFTSQGGDNAQKLAVTMGVSPGPPVLSLSSAIVNYTTSSGQNPNDQNVILQNSGGQGMNWQAIPETDNGVSWLSLTPSSGYLYGQGSTTITVHVQTQQLAPGTYQGTIMFSSNGGSEQVTVSVTISSPSTPTPTPTTIPSTPTPTAVIPATALAV